MFDGVVKILLSTNMFDGSAEESFSDSDDFPAVQNIINHCL